MVKPTDEDTIVIEKIVVILKDPKKRGMPCHGVGNIGKHQVWSGSRGSEGKTGARTFVVVFVRRNGKGRVL